MKEMFRQPGTSFQKNKQQLKSFSIAFSNKALLFVPGAFFFLLGVIAITAPMLLVAAVSFFLVLFGVFFTVVALKFIKLKRKFDDMTKQLKGKVVVQGVEIVDADEEFFEDEFFGEEEEEEAPPKKIILH